MSKSITTTFECEGCTLVGLFEEADAGSSRAVIVVVGGPQYRVGSHRQFTLLSRALAEAGVNTMRFDHRGIGDSAGETTFEDLGPDIAAAIDACFARYPDLREVVLWGLCDAASAIMMYAHGDPRVAGLIVLNPWVRSDRTLAQSYLSAYYLKRLTQVDFWRQLFSGRVAVGKSLLEFWRNLRLAKSANDPPDAPVADEKRKPAEQAFQSRMMDGLSKFPGNTLVLLSGKDLTANEFKIFVDADRKRRRLMKRDNIRIVDYPEADHTFSTAQWRRQVSERTIDWIGSW